MFKETVSINCNKQVGKDIWIITFQSEKLALISKPGQFLMVHLEMETRDPLLGRPFSIHRIENKDRLSILYKRVGKGTFHLSTLKPGDSISVVGPLGNGFPMINSRQKTLLIGGGMGVAPLFFLAQSMKNFQKDNSKIFIGYSTSDEIVLSDELEDLGITISFATEDGSLGVKGPVTDLLDRYLNQGLSSGETIYACGPNAMLKKIAQMAIITNIHCYVSMEVHMACGLGICQGCAVKSNNIAKQPYHYVCKDGPVFSAEMIDWESFDG